MRHSIAVGVCLVIAAFAPGCPKDDKSDDGATSENGGSSSGGQQMGHGDDTSHSGTGGSATSGGGNNGGGGMHDGSGGGAAAHDAGTAHDPGHAMTDAGSGTGGDIKDAGADQGGDCDLTCDPGSHCELVQVQCIRAPCPPQKECVPDEEKQFCGGFAAFECPGGGECVDDPSDDCDPMNGGADCGGMCVCEKAASCVKGKHWDGRPSVCACVDDSAGDGEACGSKTCPSGQVCCNASCGICTPPDGACTQQVC
jgi:hypothetical protein